MNIGIQEFLTVSAILFSIGFFGVLFRRNTIIMLMSLELMLNAVNLALVGFSRHNQDLDGSLFVFFIITVAAAEVAVGLAILVGLYRRRESVMADHLNLLHD